MLQSADTPAATATTAATATATTTSATIAATTTSASTTATSTPPVYVLPPGRTKLNDPLLDSNVAALYAAVARPNDIAICTRCEMHYDPNTNPVECAYHPGTFEEHRGLTRADTYGIWSCCQRRDQLDVIRWSPDSFYCKPCAFRTHTMTILFYITVLLLALVTGPFTCGTVNAIDVHHQQHTLQLRSTLRERLHLEGFSLAGNPSSGVVCEDEGAVAHVLSLMSAPPNAAVVTPVKILTKKYGKPSEGREQPDHYWSVLAADDVRCFGPSLQYRDRIADVTATDPEFLSGCTIYKTKALTLRAFETCVNTIWPYFAFTNNGIVYTLLSKAAINSDSLSAFSKLLFRAQSSTYDNPLDDIAQYVLDHQVFLLPQHRLKHTKAQIVEEVLKCAYLHPSQTEVTKVGAVSQTLHLLRAAALREALVCYTPMMNAPGMLSHGLAEHTKQHPPLDWVDPMSTGALEALIKKYDIDKVPAPMLATFAEHAANTFSANYNAKGTLVQECNVHPVCARLATGELRHWQHINYKKRTPTHPKSYAECTNYDEGPHRCRFYARCFGEALKRVCAAQPKCCPTAAMHNACKPLLTDSSLHVAVTDPAKAGATPATCHICTIPQNDVDRTEWALAKTVEGAQKQYQTQPIPVKAAP